MHCFHALPLPEQILITVLVNTGDKALAVKAAGYAPNHGDDIFIQNKMSRHDFLNAYRAIRDNPALIHEPAAALDIPAVKKMAVRAFEAELGNEGKGRVEMIRLLWEILKAEKTLYPNSAK